MMWVSELKGLVLCHANSPASFQPAARTGASFQRRLASQRKNKPKCPRVSRNDYSFKNNRSVEEDCIWWSSQYFTSSLISHDSSILATLSSWNLQIYQRSFCHILSCWWYIIEQFYIIYRSPHFQQIYLMPMTNNHNRKILLSLHTIGTTIK